MMGRLPTYLEFKRNAQEFLRLYVNRYGLEPNERILEVGSGIGRKAILLTKYLNAAGSYDGIDIVRAGIDWCSEKASPKHPNFRFQHINVYNRHYNPNGTQSASTYHFPFSEGSFGFVTLQSVFTHMLPADIANYLAQIRRVMAENGRCLISWFLLNRDALRLIREGKSTLPFIHQVGNGVWTTKPEDPEAAIAYEEALVRKLYEQCGLKIKDPIDYGSWCGRDRFLSYQDLILAFGS